MKKANNPYLPRGEEYLEGALKEVAALTDEDLVRKARKCARTRLGLLTRTARLQTAIAEMDLKAALFEAEYRMREGGPGAPSAPLLEDMPTKYMLAQLKASEDAAWARLGLAQWEEDEFDRAPSPPASPAPEAVAASQPREEVVHEQLNARVELPENWGGADGEASE